MSSYSSQSFQLLPITIITSFCHRRNKNHVATFVLDHHAFLSVESQSRLPLPNDRPGEKCEDFFADILSKVLQTSRPNDVLLVLRDSLSGGQANDILGKIAAATTQHVPTLYVNADQTEPEFQVSSWAMSRDLVMYIYISGRGPDIVEGELVAEDTKRFTIPHPRYSHWWHPVDRVTISRRCFDVVEEDCRRNRRRVLRIWILRQVLYDCPSIQLVHRRPYRGAIFRRCMIHR